MKNSIKLGFTTVMIFVFIISGYAQKFDPEKYKTFYNFKTVKQPDFTRTFEVSFSFQNLENKQDEMPVYKANIQFFNILGENEVEIGKAVTDKTGHAKLTLNKDQKYLKDNDGFIKVVARFEGSELVESQEEEVLFKDVFFELDATEVDSVKTVSLRAYTLNDLGEEVDVDSTNVVFMVGGMLSKLSIHDGMIEQGLYEFEYDSNLPGDQKGNLTIYAVLEDDENFLNVIQSKNVKFGTPIAVTKVTKNQLWSAAAPIWMYIVLGILLIGVWVNFGYTIKNLIQIKKESQLVEEKSE